MRVLWICGLPEEVRLNALSEPITVVRGAAWSWILGHLPAQFGVELHILCPVLGMGAKRIDFEYRGVRWHCFRQDRYEQCFFWLRFFVRIRSFVRSFAPEVIHGWGGETGCGLVATFLTKKAVVSVQGLLQMFFDLLKVKNVSKRISFRDRLLWFLEKMTYHRANILLVESEASRIGLKNYYAENAVVVPHPLRPEFLKSDLSQRVNLASRQIKFVYLGGLTARKGAIDAVKAFNMLLQPNSIVVMIGEGEERTAIQEFSLQKGLTGRVILRGTLDVESIVREFSDAQFFLLPSYGDTGPTALKEALACGLYPICYNNSGPKDLIERYGCGSLVETANINELCRTMSGCIDKISDCIALSLTAANVVRNELSRENVWKNLMKQYKFSMKRQ